MATELPIHALHCTYLETSTEYVLGDADVDECLRPFSAEILAATVTRDMDWSAHSQTVRRVNEEKRLSI